MQKQNSIWRRRSKMKTISKCRFSSLLHNLPMGLGCCRERVNQELHKRPFLSADPHVILNVIQTEILYLIRKHVQIRNKKGHELLNIFHISFSKCFAHFETHFCKSSVKFFWLDSVKIIWEKNLWNLKIQKIYEQNENTQQ